MPGQATGIEIGTEAAAAQLARIAGPLASPRPVMDEIGRHLVASTLRRFAQQRGPDGAPWLKSARALADGGRTLVASGRLRASISHTVAADGSSVEVGSSVSHAAVHQFGGRAGKGRSATLPARPFLGIDDRDRNDIVRILSRALEGAAG